MQKSRALTKAPSSIELLCSFTRPYRDDFSRRKSFTVEFVVFDASTQREDTILAFVDILERGKTLDEAVVKGITYESGESFEAVYSVRTGLGFLTIQTGE